MKDAPVRHRIEYAAYRVVKGLLRALPHTGARKLGRGLGALAWAVLGRRRRVALDNLRLAFPELPEAQVEGLAAESLRLLGESFCDALSAERFDAVEFCRRLTLEGFEHLQAADAHGHGVFVMSAHLGMWEAAAHPVGLYQRPMDVVGRPLDNPYLDRDLTRLRTRFGNRVILKRGAARGMMRVLKRHGLVGILIDQRAQPGDAIDVDFFGHPARTSSVVARLALRTGAPVVPLFGYGEPDGRYRVVFREPIYPPQTSADTEEGVEEQVHALTARYLAAVEEEIRRRPAQWMWLHRRWQR
ncbi:MAG: lysophospholipid acyltransferase family protein [Acidobacteria bacterium]|nr:lysophospholipid acyltransferase family protein [Acidobacteriota bacterium]